MIHLKKRKIFKTNCSYLMTLPQDWIANHDIDPGEFLELRIDNDGTLLIRPEAK